jgi:hypothetical protein
MDVPAQSLRAREAEWELGTLAIGKSPQQTDAFQSRQHGSRRPPRRHGLQQSIIADLESDVRRLLNELHRRQHEHERRPSSRLDAHLDARATSDVLLKAAEAIERLKGLDVRAACRRARELPAA